MPAYACLCSGRRSTAVYGAAGARCTVPTTTAIAGSIARQVSTLAQVVIMQARLDTLLWYDRPQG